MNHQRETIYALATPPGRSGLAVIRISGGRANAILSRLTQGKAVPARQVVLSNLYGGQSAKPFDQAIIIRFEGPASYTGEDVVELHLHGGPAIVEVAMSALSEQGAVPAEAGEFTKRAFENNKLDLLQAEAVADLIDAQTMGQLEQAQRQLRGELGDVYKKWRENLILIRAQIEACIDFPEEEDVIESALHALEPKVATLISAVDAHMQGAHRGERIRAGLKIALLGPVNAGKSTLLNRLAGEEAAIVSDLPGTTRDIVKINLVLGGFLVELADTAGLRKTTQHIEIEGIKRAKQAAEDADIRVLVLDMANQSEDLSEVMSLVRDGDFIVFNKSDLAGRSVNIGPQGQIQTFTVSAKTGGGIKALLSAIERKVCKMLGEQESPSLSRARHRQAVLRTRDALQCAMGLLVGSPELAGEHLREANAALGQITGEAGAEEVLGKIFSAFCIGK